MKITHRQSAILGLVDDIELKAEQLKKCFVAELREPKTGPGDLSNEALGSGEWVPVAERLPETGTYCFVAAGDVQFMACAWNGKEFEWADGYKYGESAFDPFPSELATHWWPLPEAPRQ